MNENRLVTELRRRRVTTDRGVDARVLEALEPELAAGGDAIVPARRHSQLAVAAVILVSLAIVTWVFIDRGAQPPEQAAGAPDPRPAPDARAQGLALSRSIDATLAMADLVLRVRFDGEPELQGATTTVAAVVERVLSGDAARGGDKIVLEQVPWNGRSGWVQHSCLNQTSIVRGQKLAGTSWLIALKRNDGPGPQRLSIPWGDGLLGTPLDQAVGDRTATGKAAILAELCAALGSDQVAVRAGVMRALRNWQGGGFPDPGAELWADAALAARLLEMARDPAQEVRWHLAFMIPKAAGAAGERTLFRFLFDPAPIVRQPARMQLQSRGHHEVIDTLEQVEDLRFEEWTSKQFIDTMGNKVKGAALEALINDLGADDTEQRARAAWQLGFQEATPAIIEALVGALQDDAAEVRRWAAHAAGRLGNSKLRLSQRDLQRLQDRHAAGRPDTSELQEPTSHLFICALLIAHDEARFARPDPRVSVQIGQALLRLGRVRPGLDVLRELCRQSTAPAVVQALVVLAAHGGVEALAVIADAVRDPRPVVRAFAGANLHRFEAHAEHQVAALRGDLRDDEHPLVRASVQ